MTKEEILNLENERNYKIKNNTLVGLTKQGKKQENLIIPDGITRIADCAFEECNAKSITIPKSVEKICYSAFINCYDLKQVTFEEGSQLNYIESLAFRDNDIKSIVIPKSVTTIGAGVFDGCSLESVTFEEGSQLEAIGANAFINNDSLKQIKFPKSIKKIYSGAFYGCSNLEIIFEKDSSLEYIGEKAFSGCKKIKEIHIPGEPYIACCSFDEEVLVNTSNGIERIGNMDYMYEKLPKRWKTNKL